jgi:hypothetical protein
MDSSLFSKQMSVARAAASGRGTTHNKKCETARSAAPGGDYIA